MYKLKNKVALVTGSASGIGKATAELFKKEGANLILLDFDKKVRKVAKDLSCDYFIIDVSIEESWIIINKFILEKYNRLDVLVNNAGTNGYKFRELTPEDMHYDVWKQINDINVGSVFLGCKHAIHIMKQNFDWCCIVNVSSRSAFVGVPDIAAYAASKASSLNYTKSVALYCAREGYKIRCNYVAPAAIYTNMWKEKLKSKKAIKDFSKNIPLQRMGKADEVAKAILYLSCSDSSFCTGTGIIVDGGILSQSSAEPSLHRDITTISQTR